MPAIAATDERAERSESIVGIRSRIGEDCRIEQTVVMGADYFESREDRERSLAAGIPAIGIGAGSEVRRAIIDKNARIGRGVRLINRDGAANETAENYVIVNGIIVVPKNAVIPDGAVV